MKSRKREKGERGSELYMEQGELCKHIECVEGKGFFAKKIFAIPAQQKLNGNEKINHFEHPFPSEIISKSDQSDLVIFAFFSSDLSNPSSIGSVSLWSKF